MQRILFISLFLLSVTSCRSELEKKYHREIAGLWKYVYPENPRHSYMGCSEFFENGSWRRHDGCTIAEGKYWFEEDTLITTIENYTNFEEFDTSKAIIIKLEFGEMTTFDLLRKDTVYYQSTDNTGGNSCWSFD